MQVIRSLNVANYPHRSYRTVGLVSSARQGSKRYTEPGHGVPAGRVECFDHQVAYPLKGTWHPAPGVSKQWAKATSRAYCEYRHTGPIERADWVDWRVTLILHADRGFYDWFGFDSPA